MPSMPTPKVYEFCRYIGELCVDQSTDVYSLSAKLRLEPMELVRIISGKAVATKAVVQRLAIELGSDVRFLEKLADEVRRDLAPKS
jgi:hypothetical protein